MTSLAVPTDFVQTEALYVLAGRSDSGAVQDLIYQANRIADTADREAALAADGAPAGKRTRAPGVSGPGMGVPSGPRSEALMIGLGLGAAILITALIVVFAVSL